MINDSDKNITSLEKSKLDWKNYTKDSKHEAELIKNRKDGFLAKRQFLEAV